MNIKYLLIFAVLNTYVVHSKTLKYYSPKADVISPNSVGIKPSVVGDNFIIMEKISGIYKIESKIKSKRIYIGSAININSRQGMHLYQLRKNKHHSPHLQKHFNKYGEADLIFSVLLSCVKEDLLKTEQFFIDSLNPFFNCCKIAGSRSGVKATQKTRDKIRIAKTGTKASMEVRKKMSESRMGVFGKWNKGRSVSMEARKKMSETHKLLGTGKSNKGRILTNEHKEKIRLNAKVNLNYGMKNKKLSDEQRQKISKARTGSVTSEETKIKLSIIGKGRIFSEETRERLSIAALKMWAKRKTLI